MCSRLPGLLAVAEKGPQTAWPVRVHLLHGCDLGCEREMIRATVLLVCLGIFEGVQQVRIEDSSDCNIVTKKKIWLYFAFSTYTYNVSCY